MVRKQTNNYARPPSRRELNSTTVSHDGAVSEIFLDKVVNAGPSVMFRFYMDHQGKPQHGLPLFNDPGVSTIDVDNIPAYNPGVSTIKKEIDRPS